MIGAVHVLEGGHPTPQIVVVASTWHVHGVLASVLYMCFCLYEVLEVCGYRSYAR